LVVVLVVATDSQLQLSVVAVVAVALFITPRFQ
jgi:hypothetical protein